MGHRAQECAFVKVSYFSLRHLLTTFFINIKKSSILRVSFAEPCSRVCVSNGFPAFTSSGNHVGNLTFYFFFRYIALSVQVTMHTIVIFLAMNATTSLISIIPHVHMTFQKMVTFNYVSFFFSHIKIRRYVFLSHATVTQNYPNNNRTARREITLARYSYRCGTR